MVLVINNGYLFNVASLASVNCGRNGTLEEPEGGGEFQIYQGD